MSQLAAGLKTIVDNGRERRTDGLMKHLGMIDAGSLRAVDNLTASLPQTGAGLELLYAKPTATSYIQSIDRDTLTWRDLIINARNTTILSQGGAVAMNGRLQVSGGIDSVAGNLPATGISTPGDVSVNRGNNTGAYYFVDASHFLFWDGTQFVLNGGKLTLGTPGSIRTADIAANAVQQQIGAYAVAPTFSTTVTSSWVTTPVSVQFTTTGGLLRIEMSMPIYHTAAGAGFYVGLTVDGPIHDALAFYNAPGPSWTVNFGMTWYLTLPAGLHTFAIAIYNATVGTLAINAAAYSTMYVTEQKR